MAKKVKMSMSYDEFDERRSKALMEGLDSISYALRMSDYQDRVYLLGRIFEVKKFEIDTRTYTRFAGGTEDDNGKGHD